MLPAFGLYTHIQANRRRSALLLAGLFLLVYAVAYAGALAARALTPEEAAPDLEGLLRGALADMVWVAPLATLAALAWIAIGWVAHQKMIDLVTGARPIERGDDPRLYDLLEALCISRGMTMPRLKVMETQALNAFASGLREGRYAVTVTRGLRESLDEAELEAVLAHELTHIRNEDVRLMVIAVIIAGVVSFAGELLFRSLRFGVRGPAMGRGMGGRMGRGTGGAGGRRGGGGGAAVAIALLIAVAIVLIAWLLSGVIRFALSRSREFLADAGAVELTKNPDAMISALLKISGRSEMPKVPSGIMEMCIDYPRRGFADIFATHPPIEARIAALERFAGGHRPADGTPPEPGSL